MRPDTREEISGGISHGDKPPLDVRIVAYYLYVCSFLVLIRSSFLVAGSSDAQSHRVLLGSVAIASELADSVYGLVMGICSLLCAWGLMRRSRFAWWFSVIFLVYSSTDAVLMFPQHQIGVAVCVVIDIALVTWLWFRKDLYGVRAT